jgi:hypothetical protein
MEITPRRVTMSEDGQSRTTHRLRCFILYVVLLLVAFLIGFVPMWLKSRECSSSLAEAKRQSSLARMENSLASAAIDARRGDYETARQAASDFFTSLRTEFNRGVDSALSQAEITSLQPPLSRRDEIVTLLARGDATSADSLSDLYVSYRTIVNR